MNIKVDTHSHTTASGHAYCSLREMAKMAADKGLEGLAITEHAPQMPGTCQLYYFQNLRVVPRKLYGIRLLLGTELNILNVKGEVDLDQSVIGELDIAIASIHTPCFHGERTKENITRAYVNAMANPLIDIIGHPDDGRFPTDYEWLAREAVATDTLLELNNSSLKPGGFRQDTLPNAKRMLEYCKKHKAMIVVSTDAHMDEDVGEFHYAMGAIKEVDFPEELIANTSLVKLQSFLKGKKKV